jgi:hypothetical protein
VGGFSSASGGQPTTSSASGPPRAASLSCSGTTRFRTAGPGVSSTGTRAPSSGTEARISNL